MPQWDEDRYGLEYDLDVYNIVDVSDFNMGAMENKGLNICERQLPHGLVRAIPHAPPTVHDPN